MKPDSSSKDEEQGPTAGSTDGPADVFKLVIFRVVLGLFISLFCPSLSSLSSILYWRGVIKQYYTTITNKTYIQSSVMLGGAITSQN